MLVFTTDQNRLAFIKEGMPDNKNIITSCKDTVLSKFGTFDSTKFEQQGY